MTKLIAITGKMGSGKSEVLNLFKNKGYAVFSADKIYKDLLLNEDFVEEISSAFNISPIIVNGKKVLDKKAISNLVFSSQEKLNLLNSITHPKIMEKMLSLVQGEVAVCEVPLLQGSGYEERFSVVIEVVRDNQKSIEDASTRDNLTQKEVADRIKFQPKYENKSGITHIIINNDSSLEELYNKVSAIEKNIY